MIEPVFLPEIREKLKDRMLPFGKLRLRAQSGGRLRW